MESITGTMTSAVMLRQMTSPLLCARIRIMSGMQIRTATMGSSVGGEPSVARRLVARVADPDAVPGLVSLTLAVVPAVAAPVKSKEVGSIAVTTWRRALCGTLPTQ